MNWDAYFLNLAKAVAVKSSCLSRQVGAVIARENSIVSTGYNGAPRGVPSCAERNAGIPGDVLSAQGKPIHSKDNGTRDLKLCPRRALGYPSGEGLHLCLATHAEKNAIINAARNGVSTLGCILYLSCDVSCCKDCLGALVNAGIKEVVVESLTRYDYLSGFILKYSDIKIRQYELG